MTRVLVTGASGYLGSRLCAFLAGGGHAVRAAVRTEVPWLAGTEQVVADPLSDPDDLAGIYRGCHAVVHLAAPNEVVAAEHPDEALCATVAASRHAALAAAAAGVRRFVYLSTVHVYGQPAPGARLSEDVTPQPVAAYAIARLASEHTVAGALAGGPALVVFRLTNSVGAPVDARVARWTLVANDLCRQAVTTGELHLRTHGYQWRDFIAMEDVCRVLGNAVMPDSRLIGTYNLGAGTPMTIRDLAVLVQDAAEARTGHRPPLVAPDAPADIPASHTVVIDRLLATGWRPQSTVRAAVDDTVAFCVEHKGEL